MSRGQLNINGNNIELKGEVANESQRQQLAADMATALNPTYSVRNALRVAAQPAHRVPPRPVRPGVGLRG